MKKHFLLYLSVILIAASCRSSWVDIQYFNPAYMNLPADIKTIVLIDRTAPQNDAINIIEGGISGEGIGEDADAAFQIFNGINDVLMQTSRFKTVKDPKRHKSGSVLKEIPGAMSWATLQPICTKNGAQAALVVESFDSDFTATHEAKTDANTGKTTITAKGTVKINGFIRIYNMLNKTILDEYRISQTQSFSASGQTVRDAMNALQNKRQATLNASYNSGYAYGERISPTIVTARRDLFNRPKKSSQLVQGIRKAEVADWDGAIASWTMALQSTNAKVARRAAYNIAVAYEVKEDFAKAKEWASKAYTQYGEKKAKYYFDVLRNREQLNQRASEQLSK